MFKQDCKLRCCLSCTLCNRAVRKQRLKSQSVSNKNKVCETCLLCKSLSLCSNCSKCPSCCRQSTCGGPSAKVLAGLALPGCKPKGCFNSSGGVQPTLQRETSSNKVTGHYQWICKSGQKQTHKGLLTRAHSETGCRKGDNPILPSFLQPVVSSSKTQPKMETHLGLKSAELLPSNCILQDGDTRDHPTLPSKRGVGDVSGFQRRLLPYSDRTKVAEIPQVLPPQSSLSVHSPPLWPLNGSVRVHKGGQGSQVNGTGSGYQDPPVPRRLVVESPVPGNVSASYPDPLGPMPQVRVGSQYDQVGVGASAGFQLCRLPFRPLSGAGQTDPGEVDDSVPEDHRPPQSTGVFGPTVHVPYRTANSHRETGSGRATSHAPYPVASEEALACPGVIGKAYPSAAVPSSTPEVVVDPKQCPKRSTSTPTSTRSSAVYRRLKRRLGCSLRRLHSKRPLVHTRKRLAHKLAGTQGRLTSPKTVRAIVLEPDHSGVFRQHNSGLLHKQGGRYEIRLSLCSPLEAADVVQPEADSIKSKAYSGSPQCHCRQVVPARSGDTNGMVPPTGSLRPDLQKMAQAGGGPICDQVQSQTSQICVPGSGSTSLESGCSKRSLARSGCLCVSPGGSPREGGLQVDGSRIPQSHSHCTRVAQHVMVLGSGQHVSTDSPKSAESREPVDSTLQSVSSQGPSQSEPACMAPRAFAIQQAGFSEEVATRIEAPQRRSTRAIYESKWSVFVRWCEEHKVDFRSPSIKQISDFLLYLFQEKRLQPSTIDGYRTAISDKIGNGRVNIGKDENLTRLLDSFHRDKPKGRRGVPSWNLSLVLHHLTKPPFEPLRKASLKHLTFKTVFLLALGSGKRRSEIHAWVHRNIRHQEDWSNVSLYPSPSFISKNHLAKEGPGCVAPVIIPALAPTLDKSLKEDRTLCPVRSLRYYLDKTKDLRSDKELVFISFRKSFKKDIVPATVSSWIKQTIGLCYQLSDEQSQNLHQVRAHDVRAFAASKAFQGGVPLDQILSACHWKSHNTFTQFYLKDVAWADSELYHLGPVVAAQQIRD